jgi:hypothetical protein
MVDNNQKTWSTIIKIDHTDSAANTASIAIIMLGTMETWK